MRRNYVAFSERAVPRRAFVNLEGRARTPVPTPLLKSRMSDRATSPTRRCFPVRVESGPPRSAHSRSKSRTPCGTTIGRSRGTYVCVTQGSPQRTPRRQDKIER